MKHLCEFNNLFVLTTTESRAKLPPVKYNKVPPLVDVSVRQQFCCCFHYLWVDLCLVPTFYLILCLCYRFTSKSTICQSCFLGLTSA